MDSRIFKINVYLMLLISLTFSTLTFADEEEEEALLELYGDEELVSIATGTAQPISKAPAVASVITAADIKEIGARDIDDVLETVPGLHVSRSPIGSVPIYTFRGIYASQNPQVLILINGISISNLFTGNRNQVWGGMPVESISRIEVIRGPGSAVYGADAFAGVINIVTKTGSEINGTEVGLRYGSFDTKESWILHGGNYAGFEVGLMAEIKSTDGHHEDVNSDVLTGSGASLTPGSTTNGRDNLDLRLDVEKGMWNFRGGLQRRRNVEIGFGVGQALDTNAEYESDRWNADLTYLNPEIADNLDFQVQASFFNTSQIVSEDTFILPPGAPMTPPIGLIGNPEVWERHWRFNTTSLFTGFENHQIRVGAGYTHSEIYRVEDNNNFNMTGLVMDVSDTPFAFLPEKHRDNKFGFIQDVWSIANDWELTAGIRYDDYNDFGDTWNPRAALVWSARYDTTVKLLYGQAFRAPSFAEFRNRPVNPVAVGNDDLDPEEIETIEFAVDYRPFEDLHFIANVFYYEWDDIITFVADPLPATTFTAQNAGEQTGYGFELEMEWNPNSTFSLLANYAFQDSEDEDSNEDSGNAPHHQIYARADWEFLPGWTITPAVNYVIDRDRPPLDTRDELDDYAVFDLTLRSKAFSDQWELSAGVRNLFNSSPEEPTDASLNISNDLPLERRSAFAELRIDFQ
ncbi:MAG: TonB-dependent receptor [Gammaproteobacteria bacterium]|nr:TonB-dependent receptor [Gammaproteobacteria bacterium]